MKRVAVLGGGPAGAYAAEIMASAGVKVTLYDEKLAWEKPCGGGVTFKAYHQYPFLAENSSPKNFVRTTHLSYQPAGDVRMELDQAILIYSRNELNKLMLERASKAGAQIEKTRVLELTRREKGWSIRTKHGVADAEFCVIATGARNALAGTGTEFKASDTMVALGYFVEGEHPRIDVEFLTGAPGYIWVFPRRGHLSIGIGGKGASAQQFRARLEQYMDDHGFRYKGAEFYAHKLPSLGADSFRGNRISGDGWLAVGDAAGLVDPITGEGIYYAIRSGDFAAHCIISGKPEAYRPLVVKDFMDDLTFGARISNRVYSGRFLGAPIPARTIQFTRRSPMFRGLIQDLFAGTQDYGTLKARLFGGLGKTLRQVAWSYVSQPS